VRTTAGIAAIVAGAVLGLVVTLALRSRWSGRATSLALAISGGLLGIGAIAVQDGASAAEWVLAPLILAALLPVHVRLLYRGKGPLRT
jgi:hypothetical protein